MVRVRSRGLLMKSMVSRRGVNGRRKKRMGMGSGREGQGWWGLGPGG